MFKLTVKFIYMRREAALTLLNVLSLLLYQHYVLRHIVREFQPAVSYPVSHFNSKLKRDTKPRRSTKFLN